VTGYPVVILAGGEARRIGGDKPLRTLGNARLIDRALAVARGWSDDVAVSVRSADQLGDPGAPILIDDPALEGPLAGLASALRHARAQTKTEVLTIACDMPFLPADLGPRLGEALAGEAAALAASGGRLHPVCALWRAAALDALPDYVRTGRRSLHGFAEQIGFTAVAWPAEPFDPFFNINDEQELRAAEARLGESNPNGLKRPA